MSENEVTRESSSVSDILTPSEQDMTDIWAQIVSEIWAPPSARNAAPVATTPEKAASRNVVTGSIFTHAYELDMNRS